MQIHQNKKEAQIATSKKEQQQAKIFQSSQTKVETSISTAAGNAHSQIGDSSDKTSSASLSRD